MGLLSIQGGLAAVGAAVAVAAITGFLRAIGSACQS